MLKIRALSASRVRVTLDHSAVNLAPLPLIDSASQPAASPVLADVVATDTSPELADLVARLTASEFAAVHDLKAYAARSDAEALAAAAAVAPLLSHPHQETRFHAAAVMGQIPHAAAAPHLRTLLEMVPTDGAEDEFHFVSHALIELCVTDDDACAARLVEMLAHAEPNPRCTAIYILTLRGSESSADHVAAVAASLELDDNSRGSFQPWNIAARCLGQVGALAVPHLESLVRLLARTAATNAVAAKRAAADSLVRLRDRLTETHVLSIVALLACDEPAAHGGGSLSTRRAALLALSGVCEGREGVEEERTPLEKVEEDIGRGWRARRGELPKGVTAAVAAAVVALLEADDEDSREVGARAAGSLGMLVGEVDAVPALVARMAKDTCEVQSPMEARIPPPLLLLLLLSADRTSSSSPSSSSSSSKSRALAEVRGSISLCAGRRERRGRCARGSGGAAWNSYHGV